MSAGALLSASAARVQEALHGAGLTVKVFEHRAPARTAQEAAQVLGCELGQITKSLVFRGVRSGAPLLVLTSGVNRVDLEKAAHHAGEPLVKADAAFTREVTGYAIGGIPPLGHPAKIKTLFDQDLLRYPVIHPAGGTPHATFPVLPADLLRVTGAILADVREESRHA
jgi:prolyl-tRNA editing enzyme YbaK/EbsC (Cys-tRNA(Pro) deacylase)